MVKYVQGKDHTSCHIYSDRVILETRKKEKNIEVPGPPLPLISHAQTLHGEPIHLERPFSGVDPLVPGPHAGLVERQTAVAALVTK